MMVGHDSVENCSIVTKIALDLDIIMINLHNTFISIFVTSEKEINGNCKRVELSNFEGHNSLKNSTFVPKIELNVDFIITNLYTRFYFNMCNICEENEQKLLVDRLTDISKAIYAPFFEGEHKNNILHGTR